MQRTLARASSRRCMIGATPLRPRGSLAAGLFRPELPSKPPPAGSQGGTGNPGSPARHRKTGSGGRRRTRKGRGTVLPVSMYYLGCQDCQRPLSPHRRRRKGGRKSPRRPLPRTCQTCRAPPSPPRRPRFTKTAHRLSAHLRTESPSTCAFAENEVFSVTECHGKTF